MIHGSKFTKLPFTEFKCELLTKTYVAIYKDLCDIGSVREPSVEITFVDSLLTSYSFNKLDLSTIVTIAEQFHYITFLPFRLKEFHLVKRTYKF